MAILDALPGLEVSVCVDDEALKEFDEDEEVVSSTPGAIGQYQAARTVTKYIEALSDKEFIIKIVLDNHFSLDSPALMIPILIDGKWVREPFLQKLNEPFMPLTRIVDGSFIVAPGKPNEQFLQTFKFCKIETTIDDDKLKDAKDDAELISKVGEIQITVYRASRGVLSDPSIPANYASSLQTKIHEKALKGNAKSHNISFGTATKLMKKSYVEAEEIDGKDYPIAIFKFKYRSKDALKSLMIMERTPSPEPERVSSSPSPPPVDFNNLDPAQKRKLARVLNDMNRGRSKSRTPTIKRERVDDNGEGSSKRRKSGTKVTIDLTEESDEENIVPMR